MVPTILLSCPVVVFPGNSSLRQPQPPSSQTTGRRVSGKTQFSRFADGLPGAQGVCDKGKTWFPRSTGAHRSADYPCRRGCGRICVATPQEPRLSAGRLTSRRERR